jgi:hypothetical protein
MLFENLNHFTLYGVTNGVTVVTNGVTEKKKIEET